MSTRSIGSLVKALWQHPLVKGKDVDSANTVETHRKMIESKPLLYQHYLRWYRECLPAFKETAALDGPIVEIGSGAGFLDKVIPGLVKTDVVPTPYTQRVVDAMHLDFADNELRALYLLGVFHHIPRPAEFLREAQRCLKPGGRLVMIEPTNNPFQRFLASRLDHYEYYDDKIPEWINGTEGRMSKANLAIAWVIFFRDQQRFHKEFPALQLRNVRYHTFLSYILSGGMTYRSFLPPFSGPVVSLVEGMAKPFMKRLATTMTLDFVKTEATDARQSGSQGTAAKTERYQPGHGHAA